MEAVHREGTLRTTEKRRRYPEREKESLHQSDAAKLKEQEIRFRKN